MSGRIPKQFIDNLISRVDIVDLIDKRIPLKKAGRDYQACCPFHNEKTPSFTVSQDKQFYHCFGCGAHGTAIGFLMDYAHMDFVDAIHELAGHLGLQVPTESGSSHQGPDLTPLYRILEDAADYYRLQLREHPGAPRAVTYLKDRGLSGEIAARFGIGYAPPGWDNILKSMGSDEDRIQALSQTGMLIEKESDRRYDRFRDRIMFPILDRRGRTVGFGGRILDEGTPKYLNSPETPVFHKGREVYGQCQVREVQSNPTQLLVVEGYMDVVALAQFGIHYSVATLGTAATPEHLTQLFRIAPRIIFCFDGDEAGRKAAWRALETSLPLLSEGHQALFLFLPEGDDPDTMIRRLGQEEFEHRVDRATSLSSYFFNQLTQQVDMANLDGRARLVELARPYFNKIPPGAFRQLLTQRLGELSNIKPEDLSPLLKSKSPSPPVRAIVRRDGARPPSLMRRTITLLLHHPELAKLVNNPETLATVELPGISVLTSMLELLLNNPHMKMAGILEYFRDTETGTHLLKLSRQEEPMVPGADLEQEFLDGTGKIQTQQGEKRFRELQERVASGTIAEEEKREYFKLLHSFSNGKPVPNTNT